MIYLTEFFSAFLTAVMMANLLFTRAIDIPNLYKKRSFQQTLIVGALLTGIVTVSSIPAYFLNGLFKSHAAFVPYMTLSFLLLNGAVFLGFYFGIRRFLPKLFSTMEKFLPFYGVNCVTLGTLLIAARLSSGTKFLSFFGYCFGSGVGFTIALLIMWSIRQKMSLSHTPKTFRGLPITLIYLGIVSLALFGLIGNQLPA